MCVCTHVCVLAEKQLTKSNTMLQRASFSVATPLGSARKLRAACASGPSMFPDRSSVERDVAMVLFSFKLVASIVAPMLRMYNRYTHTHTHYAHTHTHTHTHARTHTHVQAASLVTGETFTIEQPPSSHLRWLAVSQPIRACVVMS